MVNKDGLITVKGRMWTTLKGEIIPIEKMSDKHLRKVERYIRKTLKFTNSKIYREIMAEKRSREIGAVSSRFALIDF